MPRKFGFGQIDKQTMKNCALVILVVALIIGIVMVVKDKMSSFGIAAQPEIKLNGIYRLSNIYFKNEAAPVGSMLNKYGKFTMSGDIWAINSYTGYPGIHTIQNITKQKYLKTTYGNGNDNVVHLGGDDNFTTLWDISKIGDNYYISNRYFRGANLKAPYGSFLSSHYGNGYDSQCYVGPPGNATLWDIKQLTSYEANKLSDLIKDKNEANDQVLTNCIYVTDYGSNSNFTDANGLKGVELPTVNGMKGVLYSKDGKYHTMVRTKPGAIDYNFIIVPGNEPSTTSPNKAGNNAIWQIGGQARAIEYVVVTCDGRLGFYDINKIPLKFLGGESPLYSTSLNRSRGLNHGLAYRLRLENDDLMLEVCYTKGGYYAKGYFNLWSSKYGDGRPSNLQMATGNYTYA